MTLWVDAQVSPMITAWIRETFSLETYSMRELGFRDATDQEIFAAAKEQQAIIMTKDSDFLNLVNRYGTPPQIIWVTCGNTSNAALKEILSKNLYNA
ncbi:MAG: DUF5615 family PIN-like protein, partial [Ignavibacteriae bacterium]|nr:DUF5615 family PIN-like protein [Ignavibacteriota bacterium]